MAKTERMLQIEAMLAEDPKDHFLLYALAMEHASAGDDEAAVTAFRQLTRATDGELYVPAFLMEGQTLARMGREREAAEVLKLGINAAKTQGNLHALGEMQNLLMTLE